MTNPICRASYLGHKNIAALLIKHKADINLRSSDGRTALMWAAFRNHNHIAEYLIENGADTNLEDNQGWNALDIAIIRMNYETALFLKKIGMNPRDKDMYQPNLW
jgi:ankyrin repeat protein